MTNIQFLSPQTQLEMARFLGKNWLTELKMTINSTLLVEKKRMNILSIFPQIPLNLDTGGQILKTHSLTDFLMFSDSAKWPLFSLWCVPVCLWMTQCVLCEQILSLESLDLFIQVGEWTLKPPLSLSFFFFSSPSSPALPRLIRVNFNLRPLRSAKRESEMRWKQ